MDTYPLSIMKEVSSSSDDRLKARMVCVPKN